MISAVLCTETLRTRPLSDTNGRKGEAMKGLFARLVLVAGIGLAAAQPVTDIHSRQTMTWFGVDSSHSQLLGRSSFTTPQKANDPSF